MSAENDGGKRPGHEKRKLYVTAFVIALSIDLILSVVRDLPYKPSLLGLAIMITAVLYYAYSWIRER